jgi:tol-pal system protein YbgF
LTSHAQYWIGEAYFNKRGYLQAIEAYERVIANYPKSDKVPAALAKAGVAYAELGNLVKARGLLKRVVDEYPQSAEAALARRRLAELR